MGKTIALKDYVEVLSNKTTYRKWKADIEMILKVNGYAHVLGERAEMDAAQVRITQPASANTTHTFTQQQGGSGEIEEEEVEPTNLSTTGTTTTTIPARINGPWGKTKEMWRVDNVIVVAMIYFVVDDLHKFKIKPLNTAKEAFTMLDKEFINTDSMVAITMKMRVYDFQFVDNNKMREQFNKYEELMARCEELGKPISEEEKPTLLIKSLTNNLKNLVSEGLTRAFGQGIGEPTYDQIKNVVLDQFSRQQAWGITDPTSQHSKTTTTTETTTTELALLAHKEEIKQLKHQLEEAKSKATSNPPTNKHTFTQTQLEGKECLFCGATNHTSYRHPGDTTMEMKELMDERSRQFKEYQAKNGPGGGRGGRGGGGRGGRVQYGLFVMPNVTNVANDPTIYVPQGSQETQDEREAKEIERQETMVEPLTDGRQGTSRFAGGVEVHTPQSYVPLSIPLPSLPSSATPTHTKFTVRTRDRKHHS